jgi:release factor glutamine methyltransferase
MTVLEVIHRSGEFLARKGVESPRLQVELLLAHVLQLPRLKLYLNFERNLTDDETARLREIVLRRADREPLQHILGSTSFCGFEFTVSRDVLVPRPETELLAERAWKLLETLENPKVLDVGTGTGCLAITLAMKCPTSQVHATDVSATAIDVARANAERHGVAQRIRFHQCDLFSALPDEQFDVILTNPPYIPTALIETLEPEVRDHDPRSALDGGPDGLSFYRRLAVESPSRLSTGGTLLAEFGDDQHDSVTAIFSQHGWMVGEIVQDLAGKPRIIIAHRPNS